jgi:uncharacterized membrane protein YphA (DoxX/SURF4 family)
MNIVLWILQLLLAVMFLMAGFMKVTRSKSELKESGGERMAWVESVSARNIKLIGVLELLAAIGLVLPQLTGVLPWLTPLAAVGLVLTMLGAIVLHLRREDEAQTIVPLWPTVDSSSFRLRPAAPRARPERSVPDTQRSLQEGNALRNESNRVAARSSLAGSPRPWPQPLG